MDLNKERILEICGNYFNSFKNILQSIQKFESKGIFNSEMLLFISLVKYFGIKLIIESGRAKGQSSQIIALSCKNSSYKIYSIEAETYSPDIKVAFNNLKNFKNLNLLFGNSFNIIPKLITEECCILIDGPKGAGAIRLAKILIEKPLVKAIFIHDLHKDSPYRLFAEKIFNNCFFTDDLDYIKKFRHLDQKCWLDQRQYQETKSWAPYRRDNKIMKSYSSTLSVIFNSENPFYSQYYEIFLNYEKMIKRNKIWKFRYLFDGWERRIKKIIQFPLWFLFFEKYYLRKDKLDLKNLIKKWVILIISQFISILKKKIINNIKVDLDLKF